MHRLSLRIATIELFNGMRLRRRQLGEESIVDMEAGFDSDHFAVADAMTLFGLVLRDVERLDLAQYRAIV